VVVGPCYDHPTPPMSYVAKHLMPGEAVVRETHLSRIVFIPAFILLALAGLLFVVVTRGGSETQGAMPLPAVFLAGAVLMFLWGMIRVGASEFAVTNKRVIVKVGLFNRHSTETLLRQVEGITVDQGILGRIFNYGTIVIEGTGSDRTPYKGIAGPLQFRLAVQEQIDHSLAPVAAAAPDPYGNLIKLNALREQGIVSQAEFEREKRKLLGDPPTSAA
jgi:uncharacterized membrane protein YdbT with pleckstrin-like domain